MSDNNKSVFGALDKWADAMAPTLKSVEPVIKIFVVSLPRFVIGVLILAGIAINFGNVIGRYMFLEPIIWAEEIMIYIMVCTVFIGAVLVSWDGRHLKMDFFSIMLPSPWKESMNFITTVSFIGICAYVIPKSLDVTRVMLDNSQLSVVAEVPMAIPHSALFIGFVLMFIAVLFRFRSHVMGTLDSELDEIVQDYSDDSKKTDEGQA